MQGRFGLLSVEALVSSWAAFRDCPPAVWEHVVEHGLQRVEKPTIADLISIRRRIETEHRGATASEQTAPQPERLSVAEQWMLENHADTKLAKQVRQRWMQSKAVA